MSLKRKLVAAVAILLIAGGATGGALAARSHAATRTAPVLHLQGKSLLGAASAYLGIPLRELKHELRPGHPLAVVATQTPGRTVAGLRQTLYFDGLANLRLAEGPMTPLRTADVHAWLRSKVAGFVAGTCPLKFDRLLFARLGGSCPGMSMHA